MLAFDGNVYKRRREALFSYFEKGKILLLGNNLLSKNYKDNYYPFRQDSTFLYYIGINQPGLHAVLDVDSRKTYLYGDEADIDHIIWTGSHASLQELGAQTQIDEVKPLNILADDISEETHFLPPYRGNHEILLRKLGIEQSQSASVKLIDAIVEMRSIKSEAEIDLMDQASKIAQGMHQHVMKHIKPDMHEYELVAKAHDYAMSHNCSMAYPPILSVNGQILHNNDYHNQLSDGGLLLYDGGVELSSGYCSDLTRTSPVSLRFSNQQKEIYNIVEEAFLHAAELSKPGAAYLDIHLAAGKVITQGLHALGLIKGNLDDAITEGVHTLFFPHGLGHMIGLDVHDMENLGEDRVGYDTKYQRSEKFGTRNLRLARALKEGNCITIEPGIYFIPELIEKWRSENKWSSFINYELLESYKTFGGIRIEDDFVITADSNRKLGSHFPTDTKTIESFKG